LGTRSKKAKQKQNEPTIQRRRGTSRKIKQESLPKKNLMGVSNSGENRPEKKVLRKEPPQSKKKERFKKKKREGRRVECGFFMGTACQGVGGGWPDMETRVGNKKKKRKPRHVKKCKNDTARAGLRQTSK